MSAVLNIPVKFLRSPTAGRRPGDGSFRALTDGELFINTADGIACYLNSAGALVTTAFAGLLTGAALVNLLRFDAAQALTVAQKSQALSNLGFTLAGLKNRLANGNFSINQRAYASGGSIAVGNYAHDRWKNVGLGASSYTYTQSAPGINAAPGAIDTMITLPAGSLLAQAIEPSWNEGGSFTLSWAGTATGRIAYFDGTTYLNAAIGASPLTGTIPAGTTIYVGMSEAGTAGNIQLEAGSVATAFERRPYSVELALCERYYATGHYFILSSAYVAGSYCSDTIRFPVFMRAAPTVVTTAQYNSNASAISLYALGVDAIAAYVTASAAGEVDTYGVWTASAEI